MYSPYKLCYVNEVYKVCEAGTVIGKHGLPKAQAQNAKGYLRVRLYVTKEKREKHFFVHRLVALAHIPNPENKPEVNHKDGNILNNHKDNLEWVTYEENRRDWQQRLAAKAKEGVPF